MSDHVPVIPYRAELKRKALHLGALALPISILLVPRWPALVGLSVLAVLAVALDVARQRVPVVRRFIVDRAFGWMMRPEELPPEGSPIVLNGAVWMFISAVLCAALFTPGVAAAALAMLMVGDGAAAVVGRQLGRTKWPGSPKSVEGSAAYAVSAFLVGLAVVAWPGAELTAGVCAVGAVVGAVVEAVPIPLNDNIRVPLLSGLAMAAAGAL